MRIHYLTHVPFEKLGAIEPWLAANGARITATRLYHGEELPDPDDLEALIVMGGPMSADDEHRYPWLADEKRFIRACIDRGHKVLGICLGAQLIARALGARVHKNPDKEIGFFPVQSTELGRQHPLGSLFNDAPAVFHWHGDTFEIPDGALHLAHSWGCEHQAFSYGDNVLALQFHLEMGEDNARTLCQECASDLSPGPWTQSATEIFNMPQAFTANQRLLSVLLGLFFAMDPG